MDIMKKCPICGETFIRGPYAIYCEECGKERLRTSSVRERICCTCGRNFDGGPSAKYCPACRKERQKETNRKHREQVKTGASRKLGDLYPCQVCGDMYVLKAGRQTYCEKCAREAVLAKQRVRKIGYNSKRKHIKQQQVHDAVRICAWCGAEFQAVSQTAACSDACRRELNLLSLAKYNFKHGKLSQKAYMARLSKAHFWKIKTGGVAGDGGPAND